MTFLYKKKVSSPVILAGTIDLSQFFLCLQQHTLIQITPVNLEYNLNSSPQQIAQKQLFEFNRRELKH